MAHRLPNRISKTVLSTVHLGAPTRIRTTSPKVGRLSEFIWDPPAKYVGVERQSLPVAAKNHFCLRAGFNPTSHEYLSFTCLL